MRRHSVSRRLALGALALGLAPGAALAQWKPEITPVESPSPKRLRYGTALSRMTYRQETKTTEFYRPAGKKLGRTSENTLRREYQVSVWEVPTGSGVLRVETLPLMVGAKVGETHRGLELDDFPVTVHYMLQSGAPATYYGEPLDDRKPTALVLDEGEVEPGAKWVRRIEASEKFELPVTATFEFKREGRLHGRLVAEIEMEARAQGDLPNEKGLGSLTVQSRFLFDIRLGRVVYSKSRLFQAMIGKAQEGRPPEKRKIEQVAEVWAQF